MTTQTLTQDAAIEQDNLMVWFFTLPPTIFLLVMGYEALEPHVVCVIDVASELLLLWATRYLWGTRGWWLSVPGLLVVHNVLVVYVLGVEEKLTVVIPHVNEMMVEALGVGWRLLGRSMRLVGMVLAVCSTFKRTVNRGRHPCHSMDYFEAVGEGYI